jgi:hypothetical protein
MAGVADVIAPMSLGDKGVHAEQQACSKNGHAVIEALAETGRADGQGTVGQAPDHDGVYDPHAHPANLGEDKR